MIKMISSLFFLALCFTEAHADIAVIVNAQAKINSLSLEDLRSIYLGRMRTFPDGSSIQPCLNTDKHTNEEFLTRVVDKNPNQFDSYWNVRQFTAKGSAPHSLPNDDEVKTWLTSHENGIGFVQSHAMTPDEKKVKTVLIIKKKP